MRSMSCLHVRLAELDAVLLLHDKDSPAAHEWAEYEAILADIKNKRGLERLRQLIVSDGGGPSAKQRQALARDVHGGEPAKVVAVSSALTNPLVRGMATAVSWINPGFRVVEPAKIREALGYVDLEAHVARVWESYGELQRAMHPSKTLGMIASVLGEPPHRAFGE